MKIIQSFKNLFRTLKAILGIGIIFYENLKKLNQKDDPQIHF